MLTETAIAVFLSICMGCFFLIDSYNMLKFRNQRKKGKTQAELPHPSGISLSLAALGTAAYFLEALLYLVLVFTGLISAIYNSPFYIQYPFMECSQILGLILTASGYFIFIWSVISRGRYSVSWEMPENHTLITWGPYHYVRHPSYLGYFLMFFGFLLLWTNLFTLIPLIAIPGYYRITYAEEELLTMKFGDEYREYKSKTGRFFPKIRR